MIRLEVQEITHYGSWIAILGSIFIYFFINGNPLLFSSKGESNIGLLNQRDYANGNFTLEKGQGVNANFNYTSYNPPIMILELKSENLRSEGILSVYCNGRVVAHMYINQTANPYNLIVFSGSGPDWMRPKTDNTIDYLNAFEFVSDPDYGYEGDIKFNLAIRGSR